MSKLLGLEKTVDYTTLREWCVIVSDFLQSSDPGYTELAVELTKVIIKIDKKKKIQDMKAMYKELHYMLSDLPPNQIDELNEILKEKFGHCLADVAEMETKAIEKIIKRGRIQNDSEYELIWRREDKIYTDDSQYEYAEKLRKLLNDYEKYKQAIFDEKRKKTP